MKDNVTVYTKPLPNFSSDDVAKQKIFENKEEQKLMDESKFREYAIDYWEKKKHKSTGSNVKE